MSDPQTASPPELLFDPYSPDRNIVRRCASLTVNGVHCKQAALRGQNYCTVHIDREPRAFENPGHIFIPLLEDHSAIRLTCTKVVHALANERMKPDVAKEILHACSVAGSTLPRPARLQPSDLPQPRSEASLSVVDQLGTWIAPCEPFLSPSGEMTKYDELDARWTRKQQPKNEAEIDPAAQLTQSYKQVIVDLATKNARRKADESAAALAAGRPDPHAHAEPYNAGECPFATDWCGGPWRDHHCRCCTGQYKMSPDHPSFPGHDVLALVSALRNHIDSQKPDVAPHHPDAAHSCEPHALGSEPSVILDLNASADTRCSTRSSARCSARSSTRSSARSSARCSARSSTRSSTRSSARCSATHYRLQATGSNHVVKLVNHATHNIPKDKKLVPSQKHNISPQKAKERSPLPVILSEVRLCEPNTVEGPPERRQF